MDKLTDTQENLGKINDRLNAVTALILEGEQLAAEFRVLRANFIADELIKHVRSIEMVQQNFKEKLFSDEDFNFKHQGD